MTELFKSAFRSLWRKRLRTALTMGGIVIGVALVAIVSVIGATGEQLVNEELESMGLGGLSVTASERGQLEEQTLAAVQDLRTVSAAVPLMVDTTSAPRYDGGEQALVVCGIESGEIQAIGLTKRYGRMLSKSDVASAASVCVVDAAVAEGCFGRENVVGKTLTIAVGGIEETFTVVGVSQAGSMLLQHVAALIPGMVYIPYTTMQQMTGRADFDQFAVRLKDDIDEEQEARHIEQVLARVGGEDAYQAENLSAQKEKLAGVMDIVTAVLTAISAISLLVSGLSIMTIMTVSVSERTREIGIKKALGATSGRILREFLAEALLLSLGGGLVGIGIGVGAGALGLSIAGVAMPVGVSVGWLIVFAAVIGVAFGVYPAAKAAKLDPVEALRCE